MATPLNALNNAVERCLKTLTALLLTAIVSAPAPAHAAGRGLGTALNDKTSKATAASKTANHDKSNTHKSNTHGKGDLPEHANKTEKPDKADKSDNTEAIEKGEILRLTEQDYIDVANQLGIEVAAIKAVVDIEAGPSHQGFSAPGKPLVNFDMSMFQRFASRNGINLAQYRKTHPLVFNKPSARQYGSQQAAVNARLNAARSIHPRTAIEGTFWGMFQIGGFNWKKCGASSIDDFVERMSRSERDQLELFANFIQTTGLDKHLRAKNWAAFARGFNGPSYASRGYHTRMANAYAKHSKSAK